MDLCALSASEMSCLIATRKLAPSEVMSAHLDRIERLNPALNAVISQRDPDVLMREARAADDAPAMGWLHGLPLAVCMAGGYAPDVDDIVDIHAATVKSAAGHHRALRGASVG